MNTKFNKLLTILEEELQYTQRYIADLNNRKLHKDIVAIALGKAEGLATAIVAVQSVMSQEAAK